MIIDPPGHLEIHVNGFVADCIHKVQFFENKMLSEEKKPELNET